MMNVTVQQTLRGSGIHPPITDEIDEFLIRHCYRTGSEDCESAWVSIAAREECCARLYLVAVTPEPAVTGAVGVASPTEPESSVPVVSV